MITEIAVSGFKAIESHRFAMAPLTLLTGLNGAGKTSFIQAVLLAREAYGSTSSTLRLNGPFGLQLGTASDVMNWACRPPIEIEVETGPFGQSTWHLCPPDEGDALYLNIEQNPASVPCVAYSSSPRAFTYLSAERFGPRSVMATAAVPEDQLEVGIWGENCAQVLSVLGDKLIENPTRTHPRFEGKEPRLLKYEVETWLSEIARDVEISGRRLESSTVSELQFRSPGGQWVRSPNMGFGLSYALPIVLAGLIADPGGLVIVENPEAHLHPAGQSRMGIFLAWLASKDVQIIVETHSDHVLNGVRRATAEYAYLAPENACVHYFAGDRSESSATAIKRLDFRRSGSLSEWPDGFFDQYQIDISALGRARQKG